MQMGTGFDIKNMGTCFTQWRCVQVFDVALIYGLPGCNNYRLFYACI